MREIEALVASLYGSVNVTLAVNDGLDDWTVKGLVLKAGLAEFTNSDIRPNAAEVVEWEYVSKPEPKCRCGDAFADHRQGEDGDELDQADCQVSECPCKAYDPAAAQPADHSYPLPIGSVIRFLVRTGESLEPKRGVVVDRYDDESGEGHILSLADGAGHRRLPYDYPERVHVETSVPLASETVYDGYGIPVMCATCSENGRHEIATEMRGAHALCKDDAESFDEDDDSGKDEIAAEPSCDETNGHQGATIRHGNGNLTCGTCGGAVSEHSDEGEKVVYVYVFGTESGGGPGVERIGVYASFDDVENGNHYDMARDETTLDEPYVLADQNEIGGLFDILSRLLAQPH